MVQEMLKQLRDFILLNNPYLEKGYSNVYKETSSGMIIAKDEMNNGEYNAIFPNDRLGTYFYLRNNGLMNFTMEPESFLSDCMVGANQFNMPIRMVCVMDLDTDPFLLIQNLISTLSKSQIRLTYTNAIWNPDAVIETELTGVGKADIEFAKSIGSRFFLLAFSFVAIAPIDFLKLDCLQNPCTSC